MIIDNGKVRDRMKSTQSAATRSIFWCFALLFGFLQAWTGRMTLVNDTVSFLDIGDFMLGGDWAMAINGYWNPFFAFLLGLTMRVVNPTPYWEYPVVHLLMFLIFIFAMFCFDFLLRQLLLLRQERESTEELCVPDWIWIAIGYTVFLWSSLSLINVAETNPDMLVAAFFYLASGLIVRIYRGRAGWPTYLALGIILGLAYLTKAVMFPISIVCFIIVWLLGFRSRRATFTTISAVVAFLAVALPFIVPLSLSRHHLTFGESGTVLALVDIDHVPLTHWQGDNGRYGKLLHPVKQIVERPATFEFAGRAGVTYPVWYDASYWYEGARPNYRISEIIRNVRGNVILAASVLLSALNGAVIAGLFLLYWISGRGRLIVRDVAEHWFLLIPVTVTFGLYSPLHIESRYVAPFFVVGLLCLFLSVHLRRISETHRLFTAVALLLVLMGFSPIGFGTIPKNVSALPDLFSRPLDAERNPNAEVVYALAKLGLRRNDPIVSLEYSTCANASGINCEGVVQWARLGRFRIVGEVMYTPKWSNPMVRYPEHNDYWHADPVQQREVMRALAKTGARLVVSWEKPSGAAMGGWQQLEDTKWYVCWLEVPTSCGVQE
jgi:hypothetical protein